MKVFNKEGNEVNLMKNNEYIEYLGYMESKTIHEFELGINQVMLLGIRNSYNVGSLFFIQTGHNRDAAIANIVPSQYFSISAISSNKIRISSGDADGYVFIIKFIF